MEKEAILEVLRSPEGKALIQSALLDSPRRHAGLSALQKREMLERQYAYTKEMLEAEKEASRQVWLKSVQLKEDLASLDD